MGQENSTLSVSVPQTLGEGDSLPAHKMGADGPRPAGSGRFRDAKFCPIGAAMKADGGTAQAARTYDDYGWQGSQLSARADLEAMCMRTPGCAGFPYREAEDIPVQHYFKSPAAEMLNGSGTTGEKAGATYAPQKCNGYTLLERSDRTLEHDGYLQRNICPIGATLRSSDGSATPLPQYEWNEQQSRDLAELKRLCADTPGCVGFPYRDNYAPRSFYKDRAMAKAAPYEATACSNFTIVQKATGAEEQPAADPAVTIRCAADHATSVPCCGQGGSAISSQYQCPPDLPVCQGYVLNQIYGTCVSKPSAATAADPLSAGAGAKGAQSLAQTLEDCRGSSEPACKALEPLARAYEDVGACRESFVDQKCIRAMAEQTPRPGAPSGPLDASSGERASELAQEPELPVESAPPEAADAEGVEVVVLGEEEDGAGAAAGGGAGFTATPSGASGGHAALVVAEDGSSEAASQYSALTVAELSSEQMSQICGAQATASTQEEEEDPIASGDIPVHAEGCQPQDAVVAPPAVRKPLFMQPTPIAKSANKAAAPPSSFSYTYAAVVSGNPAPVAAAPAVSSSCIRLLNFTSELPVGCTEEVDIGAFDGLCTRELSKTSDPSYSKTQCFAFKDGQVPSDYTSICDGYCNVARTRGLQLDSCE